MKTCKDCAYAYQNPKYRVIDCRRHPPKIIVYGDDSSDTAFPQAIGPCGEFKQKDEDSEAK